MEGVCTLEGAAWLHSTYRLPGVPATATFFWDELSPDVLLRATLRRGGVEEADNRQAWHTAFSYSAGHRRMVFLFDWQVWFTIATVIALVVALAREVARPDLVMMGALCGLLLAGVVSSEKAFSGFSSSAVLSSVFLFVVAAGMQRTEALTWLDRWLFSPSPSLPRRLARMMSTTALVSGFVNNTPLVAILIPRFQQWAREHGVAVSKILMPLSYAAVLGGMITLIGTSTNLVVSGLLEASTGETLGLFELTWVGLPAAVAGIAYFALYGHRLLPENADSLSPEAVQEPHYHCELRVGASSPLVGRALGEVRGADGILDPSTVRRSRDWKARLPARPTARPQRHSSRPFSRVPPDW